MAKWYSVTLVTHWVNVKVISSILIVGICFCFGGDVVEVDVLVFGRSGEKGVLAWVRAVGGCG